MKVFEYIDRISLMHKLISEHRTGIPEDFALRLGIKRARLYELIEELKSYGAPIEYSRNERSFYYGQPYNIVLQCVMQPLEEIEFFEKKGGSFFIPSIFYGRSTLTFAYNNSWI